MTATTATAARTAKSVAPGQPASVKVAAGETLFPIITVVADRAIRADQEWYEGDGRGYVREFIVRDGYRFCEACNTTHEITDFPTFSVPRANGETRGRVCRTAIKARRAAKAAPVVTSRRVVQVVDTAKAMRVARAKKAAAASAVVRSAKAAAKRAAANA
jgi:hypothetical protein